jgi:Mrp family chromosome partitioning ATPase/capsular polysaccharide biosynthesis protein
MNDTQPDTNPMQQTIAAYLRILRRQWWVPLVVTAVALIAATAYLVRATPEYSASMKIVVGQGRTLFGVDASGAFQPFTQTMIDLLRSDVVARQTIQQRQLKQTPEQLLKHLSVTTNPDTSVLQVQFVANDRASAAKTLATIGSVFVQRINQNLAAPLQGASPTAAANRANAVSATVFDPAHADPTQVSPHVKRTLALALLLGLVVGVLLAFLRDALSRGIRGDREAADAFGATVLAPLPVGVLGTRPNEVPFLPRKVRDRVHESVQLLAASLRFSSEGPAKGGVIVITSARPEDGKTSVAAHLSAALSEAGAWVVAVEADLHKPMLHRMLEVEPGAVGLTNVLDGRVSVEDAIVVVPRVEQTSRVPATVGPDGPAHGTGESSLPDAHLAFLPAGDRHPRPAELLSLGSTGALLSGLRQLAEWVVVDTPPVLLSGDSFPFLQQADHVIVVSRDGQTTQDEAHAVRARMATLGVEEYHVVVTDSAEAGHRSYGYSTTAG